MKITIDISEFEYFSQAQSELASLDNELKVLLDAIHTGTNTSNAPFASQLQDLMARASDYHGATGNHADNAIANYARQYAEYYTARQLKPIRDNLLQRIKTLQAGVTRAIISGTGSRINARQILEKLDNGDVIATQIEQYIEAELDSQFNAVFAEVQA